MSYLKDPNATIDFAFDWSDWLNGDTIDSVSYIVPSGLTQETATNTTTVATIWLSGGTVGKQYTLTCRVVTAAGRTDDRSIVIRVIDR